MEQGRGMRRREGEWEKACYFRQGDEERQL